MPRFVRLFLFAICFISIGLSETLGGQVRFVGGGYRPPIAFRPMPVTRQMPVYRQAPVMRPAVVRQGYVPRQGYVQDFNREQMGRGSQFGRRAYDPNVFQGIRPGRMTAYGRSGLHPARNQTKWATIGRRPGMVFTNADGSISDEQSLDIEQMIDDTDFSTPLEPLADCYGTCIRGAVAISNDGATGSAWNSPTWEAARDTAVNWCASGTSMPCLAWATASGTEWASAVYCEVTSPEGYTLLQQGFTGQGNDLGASIRNAFRNAVSGGTFTLDQCVLKAYVAADGAHTNIGQPVPEPAPVVAANQPPPPQAPLIEARSVAEDATTADFYTYNGSTFYTAKHGDKTSFYYDIPRSALAKVGIKHGSLLFEGVVKSSVLVGYGVTYLKDCPAIKYEMTGTMTAYGHTVSLSGTQPSRDKNCRVMSYKDSRITFDAQSME